MSALKAGMTGEKEDLKISSRNETDSPALFTGFHFSDTNADISVAEALYPTFSASFPCTMMLSS